MAVRFWRLVRIVCYSALGLAVLCVAALKAPLVLDLCRDGGVGELVCDMPIYKTIFEVGFSIAMFGAFTGLPVGLAAGGLGFLLRDVSAWFRAG